MCVRGGCSAEYRILSIIRPPTRNFCHARIIPEFLPAISLGVSTVYSVLSTPPPLIILLSRQFLYIFSRSQPHFYANRSDRIRIDGFSGFPFLRSYDQCYRSCCSDQIIYIDVPATASLAVDKLENSSTRPSHPVVWPGV